MAARDVHLDEGTLVRWLDEELSVEERRDVEAHLEGCEPCRRSRERLAGLTRAFSRWAELAEPVEPPQIGGVEVVLASAGVANRKPGRWRTASGVLATIVRAPAFRAAAVLVLLAGVALAFPPIARWVDERAADPGAEREAAAALEETPPGSVSVSFLPAGDRLAIRVERRQAGGVLRVEPGSGAEVEARVIGGDGGEELTVLPDGLAVRNPDDSSARYAVAIPATVREIEVFVAGRRIWSGSPDRLPVEWTLRVGASASAGEGVER